MFLYIESGCVGSKKYSYLKIWSMTVLFLLCGIFSVMGSGDYSVLILYANFEINLIIPRFHSLLDQYEIRKCLKNIVFKYISITALK